MTEKTTFWHGEVQLLGWSETNTRGRTVTLQLNEDDEVHPFKYSNTPKGKTSGKRFAVVFVEIGDDELPVEKTPSQLAFLYCKDREFWDWANDHSFDTIDNEDAARAHILNACGITSRGQLDTNQKAYATWEAMIYAPFNVWRKERYSV